MMPIVNVLLLFHLHSFQGKLSLFPFPFFLPRVLLQRQHDRAYKRVSCYLHHAANATSFIADISVIGLSSSTRLYKDTHMSLLRSLLCNGNSTMGIKIDDCDRRWMSLFDHLVPNLV